MLRHFFSGFLTGIISLLLLLVWIYPLYSDYRAVAETQRWLVEVRPIQITIQENALEAKSLSSAGHGVDGEMLKIPLDLDLLEITETGTIIMRGGRDEQVVILIPSLESEGVTWRCIGGSGRSVMRICEGVKSYTLRRDGSSILSHINTI
jgi:hypothetical protein